MNVGSQKGNFIIVISNYNMIIRIQSLFNKIILRKQKTNKIFDILFTILSFFSFYLLGGVKMGEEVNELIREYKNGNKEKFILIVDRMNPLINKYVRLLYKDEKEDIHSEFVLCLLEAINTMTYYNEDGQCICFCSRALKNKFLELYKKSKLHFDNETIVEDEYLAGIDLDKSKYEDCVLMEDLKKMLSVMEGKQYSILYDVIFYEWSDAVIAKKNSVSRQYVHRVRRNFYDLLRDKYLNDIG